MTGINGSKTRQVFLCVVAIALAGAPAVARAEEYPKATVSKLLPSNRDYYPQLAAEAEARGWGTVLCTVLDTGRLGACEVIEESAPGYDFGAAVKKIAEKLVVVDLTKNKPGDKVTYTGNFNLS